MKNSNTKLIERLRVLIDVNFENLSEKQWRIKLGFNVYDVTLIMDVWYEFLNSKDVYRENLNLEWDMYIYVYISNFI